MLLLPQGFLFGLDMYSAQVNSQLSYSQDAVYLSEQRIVRATCNTPVVVPCFTLICLRV